MQDALDYETKMQNPRSDLPEVSLWGMAEPGPQPKRLPENKGCYKLVSALGNVCCKCSLALAPLLWGDASYGCEMESLRKRGP